MICKLIEEWSITPKQLQRSILDVFEDDNDDNDDEIQRHLSTTQYKWSLNLSRLLVNENDLPHWLRNDIISNNNDNDNNNNDNNNQNLILSVDETASKTAAINARWEAMPEREQKSLKNNKINDKKEENVFPRDHSSSIFKSTSTVLHTGDIVVRDVDCWQNDIDDTSVELESLLIDENSDQFKEIGRKVKKKKSFLF